MKFEKLCENYGVFKSVKREFYPKNISFSDQFLQSVKEEYKRQRSQIQETTGVVRDHRGKFLKALNFHLRDLESNLMAEEAQGEKLKKETQLRKKAMSAIEKEQPKVLKRNINSKE